MIIKLEFEIPDGNHGVVSLVQQAIIAILKVANVAMWKWDF